ncbi:hypothetical protein N0Y54_32860 [Nostoc punctiforme UO1]|uniref:hypothetical protein n=1 Tax=Nostoc punctiforme TaxID=272131 RepID=UPI00309BDF06
MNQYQQFQKIVNFIFLLLKEVQSLTEQEVNDIIEGSVTVKLVLHSKYGKQLNNQAKTTPQLGSIEDKQDTVNSTETCPTEQVEIKAEKLKTEEVAGKLQKLNTREEGFRVLDDFCPTKKDLQSLAVCIDIPNNKKDVIQALREKIIEATIGYRLRSRAIRGESGLIQPEKVDVETTQDEITPAQLEKVDVETSQESQIDTIEQTLSE